MRIVLGSILLTLASALAQAQTVPPVFAGLPLATEGDSTERDRYFPAARSADLAQVFRTATFDYPIIQLENDIWLIVTKAIKRPVFIAAFRNDERHRLFFFLGFAQPSLIRLGSVADFGTDTIVRATIDVHEQERSYVQARVKSPTTAAIDGELNGASNLTRRVGSRVDRVVALSVKPFERIPLGFVRPDGVEGPLQLSPAPWVRESFRLYWNALPVSPELIEISEPYKRISIFLDKSAMFQWPQSGKGVVTLCTNIGFCSSQAAELPAMPSVSTLSEQGRHGVR